MFWTSEGCGRGRGVLCAEFAPADARECCRSVRMHTLRTCERERWKERESILVHEKKV
jgi:hypothetical protein